MKNKIVVFLLLILCLFLPTACVNEESNNENIPGFDTLLNNNKLDELIDSYNNVIINYEFLNGDTLHSYCEYFYEIDNLIVKDSVYQTNSVNVLESIRKEVKYIVNNDQLSFEINDSINRCNGFFDKFTEDALIGQIYSDDLFYVAELWQESTVKYFNEKGIYYTIWFNKTTKHAEKATLKVYDENLELSFTVDVKFYYDNIDLGLNINASNIHSSNIAPITIDFIISSLNDDDKIIKVYTDKTSSIKVYNNENVEYGIYQQKEDVLTVKDLLDFDDSTITLYALPKKPAFFFECNYTTGHESIIDNLINELEKVGLSGESDLYDEVIEKLNYYFDYLYSQENMYQIKYYSNPNSQTSSEYSFILDSMNKLSAKYNEVLKKLSISSPIKDYIFKDYTSIELENLQKDYTLISNLESLVDELKLKYQLLDKSSSTYKDDAGKLYIEMSKLNHQIAVLNGYDNYYDYISEVIYRRYYLISERENLRQYVIKHILPIYDKISSYCNYYSSNISSSDYFDYINIYYGILETNNELGHYMTDYIETYKDYNLYNTMMSAFNDNAIIASSNKDSLGTAFASWDPIYQHSLIYASYYNNNLFSIIHELGHYASFYHYDFYNLKYDVSEIHSQANEWLFAYYLKDVISDMSWNAVLMEKGFASINLIIIGTFLDEFEETFYKSIATNDDFNVDDMYEIFDNIIYKYINNEGFSISVSEGEYYIYNFAVENPAYYLSYVTSQIASLTFVDIAKTSSLIDSQAKYVDLLENVDSTYYFNELIKELNLLNPFKEETYVKIKNIFTRSDIDFDTAREDVIFIDSSEIKPLFDISKENPLVNYNNDGKVLMIYFTNNYGEYYYTHLEGTYFDHLRMLSADELNQWYDENKEDIFDFDKRIKELLGFKSDDSMLGFIGMWVDVEDLYRLSYQTDINKDLISSDLITDDTGNYLSMDDEIEEYILQLRYKNLNYSQKALYTLLGYTYDINNDDEYGLSEFLLKQYSDIEVEFSFDNVLDLIEWLNNN